MPTSSRCLLGIMKMCSLCRLCCIVIAPALCPAWPGPVRLTPSDPRNYLIAESPNRQGAHFDEIANREALPRDSAQFDQPCCQGCSQRPSQPPLARLLRKALPATPGTKALPASPGKAAHKGPASQPWQGSSERRLRRHGPRGGWR